VPRTIAGVLGPELNYGDLLLIEVWMPYRPERAVASRSDRQLTVMGTLAPGVSIEQADAAIRTVAERIAKEQPVTHASWSARVAPAREGMTSSETWLILTLLVVAVGMVLLIACANVGNMLLAATAGRRRELALRPLAPEPRTSSGSC
jgi:hypothetical protein